LTVLGDILVIAGAVLMVLAALGVARLPDVMARLQAGTKAASLGLAFIFAGTALLHPSVPSVVKLALAMLFVFVTAPVAGHVIGRAAYRAGVRLWPGTFVDDPPPGSAGGDEDPPGSI
jgi:multicomponent Na+:H+ antiporter subunit G